MKKLNNLVRDVIKDSALWTHPDLPFSLHHTTGHAKVLFVIGENVSGKSLFVGSLLGWSRAHHQVAPIEVSIRQRCGAGLSDMAGFARTMMFGDESEQSTGATSTQVLEGAFGTLAARAADKSPALLVLDEPELGLSDGYAHAMGTHLAQKAAQMPELACGLVIVTHSRSLARAFEAELGCTPSVVHLGSAASWQQWLEGEAPRSVEELLALPKVGYERRRAVWRISDELKKSRQK
jgi:hypothetical protein